jgi:hypothetical protein
MITTRRVQPLAKAMLLCLALLSFSLLPLGSTATSQLSTTPEQLLSTCVEDLSGFRDSCVELSQRGCESVALSGQLVANEHVACAFNLETPLATLDEKDGLIGCTACDGAQYDDQQCQVCFFVEDGQAVSSERADHASSTAHFYPGGCLISQLHCGEQQTAMYGSRTAIGCFAMRECEDMNECLGGCSGHGTCKAAHCHCSSHYYGADCSVEISHGCLSSPRLLGGPLCVETRLHDCEELMIRLDLHDDVVVFDAGINVHILLTEQHFDLWCGTDSEEAGACRLCVSVADVKKTKKHFSGHFQVTMQCPENPSLVDSWTLARFSERLPQDCNLADCLNDW